MAPRLTEFTQAASDLAVAGRGGFVAAVVVDHPLVWLMALGWLATVVAFGVFFRWRTRALHAAHEKIAHRERLYQVLSHCNQSIVHIAEQGPLLARVCEIAVTMGEFRVAWIGLVNRTTEMVEPVAYSGVNADFFERVKVSIRDEPIGRGPGGTAIREGRTVVSNEVSSDPRLQVWRAETDRWQIRSAAGFPIRKGEEIVGCFVLYAAEPGFFGVEEVKLLEEMASDISFALKQMEREEQRRKFEAERDRAEAALRASEADFRGSFFSTSVGQVQADALTGRYLRVNPRFCQITGYSEEELLGMTFHELTHPEDRTDDSKAHDQMVQGEIAELSREKRYQRKDGRAVWVSISASLIRDDAGRPARTLAVVRDITARHLAEEARRAAEAKYRGVVEQSLVGIYIIQDDRLVFVNPKMAELFGCTPEEMAAVPLLDFVVEEDRPLVQENVRQGLARERESIRCAVRMLRKDGAIIHVEAQSGPADFEGRPAILGTLLDVTERRKIEAQLLQAHKMEAIGVLAGGIAHDFNNILAAIGGNTKLALEDLGPDHPVREHLLEVRKASERAVDLVRRILTFSRQQPQELKPMKLRPIVEEALQLLRASLPATMEIHATYAVEAVPVLADATQVHQVIMNLGANAAHAMGDRGVLEVRESVVDIDAGLAGTSPELRPGHYVRVSVSDSGCGMDRATVARIFDPFFTTKGQGEGTGLGLSVVHGIMKTHGGAITVYSEPDKGTTFHLYFPPAEGEVVAAPSLDQPVPKGNGERVMYVDDEEPLVYLAIQVLGRLGYEVAGFAEAEVALQSFLEDPDQYDAVITDLSMPRLSGRELAARFLEIRPNLPVILATGYIRPEDTESARRLGIRDLILKPNTIEELGYTLHRILGERRAEAALAASVNA